MVAAASALARVAGPQVDRDLLLAVAALVGVLGIVVLNRSPRTAAVLWLLVVCLVPCWFTVHLKVDWPPATAVGIVALAGGVPLAGRRLSRADLVTGFLVLLCVVPVVLGTGTLSTVFAATTTWGLGYLLGRLLPLRAGVGWIHDVVAVVFTGVAVGAIVEFLLTWNPFVGLSRGNALYQTWGTLQGRGGVLRAEWAFGHSIALGASLALAVPLVLVSRFRPGVRFAMVLLVLAGTVVTFSRTAMVCAVLGLVLGLVFLGNQTPTRLRVGLAAGLVALGVGVASTLSSVFTAAGSEASGSAGYRLDLGSLLPNVAVLGYSPAAQRTATGELYFGQFRSIDSALLLLGLTYGALALAVTLALYVAAGCAVVAGRATPALVAVVAHLPALLTVALITQYGIFFWFVAGLAVASIGWRPPTQLPIPTESAHTRPYPRLESDDTRRSRRAGSSPVDDRPGPVRGPARAPEPAREAR